MSHVVSLPADCGKIEYVSLRNSNSMPTQPGSSPGLLRAEFSRIRPERRQDLSAVKTSYKNA
jgi:hypothetical protein